MILMISWEARRRAGAIKATQATQATDLMVFPAVSDHSRLLVRLAFIGRPRWGLRSRELVVRSLRHLPWGSRPLGYEIPPLRDWQKPLQDPTPVREEQNCYPNAGRFEPCPWLGPSAILTGSRTRPSDWGWNGRFGPMEDRRINDRLATVYLYYLDYPDLVAVTFHPSHSYLYYLDYPDLAAVTFHLHFRFGGCHLSPSLRFGGCHLSPSLFTAASIAWSDERPT